MHGNLCCGVSQSNPGSVGRTARVTKFQLCPLTSLCALQAFQTYGPKGT